MIQIGSGGLTEIRISGSDSLTIIAEPIAQGERLGIILHTRRLLGLEGIALFPSTREVTLYREKRNRSLFLVRDRRNEEEIRVLMEGPDEEKSELVLERICVLSSFGGET
jgi:hypothetical protein